MKWSVREKVFPLISALLGMAVVLLVAEGVLRAFFAVSDIPYWVPDSLLGYRHAAGVEGTFATEYSRAHFRMNNRGWNSPRDYTAARAPGVVRVAILGDSFVEGLQVDVQKNLAGVLEGLLAGEGGRAEVYCYGISGASTAYAWRLLETEAARDRPDVVIYLFFNNDVADSVSFLSSQQPGPKFDLDSQGRLTPGSVVRYSVRWWRRAASRLALFRYFWINRGLATFWETRGAKAGDNHEGKGAEGGPDRIYEPETPAWSRAWQVTGRLIGRMNDFSRSRGIDFFVVNRPHPANFYPAASHGDINKPEKNLAREAAANGFEFIDLAPWFEKDWQAHHERFDFPRDSHWNDRGHRVAAEALNEILRRRHPDLFTPSGKQSAGLAIPAR